MGLDATRTKIIQTIFHLEVAKGHLKWSVSEISRKTKCSRSIIYYHFGRSKEAILSKVIQLMGEEFYGLTWERMELSKVDFLASAKITRDLYAQTPEFAVFYQVWRTKESKFKNFFLDFEKRYQKKLKSLFPSLSWIEIIELHSCLHGLITSPFLDEKSFTEAFNSLMFKKRKN